MLKTTFKMNNFTVFILNIYLVSYISRLSFSYDITQNVISASRNVAMWELKPRWCIHTPKKNDRYGHCLLVDHKLYRFLAGVYQVFRFNQSVCGLVDSEIPGLSEFRPDYSSSSSVSTAVIMTHNKDKQKPSRWLDYGSITGDHHWEVCPTCQGSGRISKSEEAQLVAVIPCSDQRLKPSHTKLYVCISVTVCLLTCSLILFFLFPRSLVMSPVVLQSSLVYFTPKNVEMMITNKLNISNQNFVGTKTHDLDLQVLINKIVVGRTKISNVTTVPPRSQRMFNVVTNVTIEDQGLVFYCQSTAIRPHTLYVLLQMTIKAYYLSHEEQLSMDTFEYIDCGRNTTIPHTFI